LRAEMGLVRGGAIFWWKNAFLLVQSFVLNQF
jgi:hypothetical protein